VKSDGEAARNNESEAILIIECNNSSIDDKIDIIVLKQSILIVSFYSSRV
jgi:hypothetical protein